MNQATNTGGVTMSITLTQAALMLDQVQLIVNRTRDALREHPRVPGPCIALAFAQIEWLYKVGAFSAIASQHNISEGQVRSLTEVPTPTAQQRQQAESFGRALEQHA